MRSTWGEALRAAAICPNGRTDVWLQAAVPNSVIPRNVGTEIDLAKTASRRISAQPITVLFGKLSRCQRPHSGLPCDKLNSPMVPTFRRLILILTALATLDAAAQTPAKPPLNVVLITIDTLRADHIGCYGYKQIKTPNIDALAADGARFDSAFAVVPVTLPSHTSMLTGTYPMLNVMHDFSGNKLSPLQPTLASVLKQTAYQTGAAIGAAVLDSRFGLNQGFDFYYDHFDFSRLDEANLDGMERPGNVVADVALHWLAKDWLANKFHKEVFFLIH